MAGTLLGDGCLSNKNHSCLRIVHGERQKDYVFWKSETLSGLINKTPAKNARGRWWFETFSHPFFTNWRNEIYSNGIKTIGKLLDSLDDLGVAVWFMDDGGTHGTSGLKIATCSFTEAENTTIAHWFCQKDIPAKTLKMGGYNYIVFNARDGGRDSLASRISPYLIPSMQYKLKSCRTQNPSVYQDSTRRCELDQDRRRVHPSFRTYARRE
jgi:hypothetical protein